ncbi:MAG: group II intron reverse transcriptase/maturase [Roseivirga sp.]
MDKQNQRVIPITLQMVEASYQQVRKKGKAKGADGQSQEDFERDLSKNLYKIWNRMSSGSYYPPPVREVEIPKEGGKRKLGVSTIGDRVAQGVIKNYIEPRLEAIFHEHSYGYRPSRQAHEALEAVRENCRRNAWVIDMDIEGFFDNIDHELLKQALARHVEEKWVKMYVTRWLEMPVQKTTGEEEKKSGKGVPQGGVISPLLANLYLHYTLDKWMEKRHRTVKFVRYADDVIIHCQNEREAEWILEEVSERLKACKLKMNASKTRLVNCKHPSKGGKHPSVKFDFLGYTFGPQSYRDKANKEIGLSFGPSISAKSKRRILAEVKTMRIFRKTSQSLEAIAKELNPKLRGWINYYGKYKRYKLGQVLYYVNRRLANWLRTRYKRLKGSYVKAYQMLARIGKESPMLFYHWSAGLKSL